MQLQRKNFIIVYIKHYNFIMKSRAIQAKNILYKKIR